MDAETEIAPLPNRSRFSHAWTGRLLVLVLDLDFCLRGGTADLSVQRHPQHGRSLEISGAIPNLSCWVFVRPAAKKEVQHTSAGWFHTHHWLGHRRCIPSFRAMQGEVCMVQVCGHENGQGPYGYLWYFPICIAA